MIIVKHHTSFHIAWLYRILYSKSIDAFFRDHNAFSSLDYAFNASTYAKGGIITIEIIPYTQRAVKHLDKIKNLDIDLDSTAIGLGIAQIVAESHKPLAGRDINKVKHALKDLHDQPWQSIGDIDAINAQGFKSNTDVLAFGSGYQRTNKLTIDIALQPKIVALHPELLPLFVRIANFIHWNCQGITANVFGVYCSGIERTRYGNDFGVQFVFKVPPSGKELLNDGDRLKKILQLYINWAQELQSHETILRFIKDIQTSALIKVDPGVVLNSTYRFVGAKGWQAITTKQNCDILLNNTVVKISYGRKKTKRWVAIKTGSKEG